MKCSISLQIHDYIHNVRAGHIGMTWKLTRSADIAALAPPTTPWLVRGPAVAVAPTAPPFLSGVALPSASSHRVIAGANLASELGGVAMASEIGSLAVAGDGGIQETPKF
jgi:hypothetical protein